MAESGPDHSQELARRVVRAGGAFTRRRFLGGTLKMAAAAGAATAFVRSPAGEWVVKEVAPSASDLVTPRQEGPDFVIAGDRDTDLVLIDFMFNGFEVQPATGTEPASIVAVQQTSSNANYIQVQFPPQSVGEAAYSFNPSSSGPSGQPFTGLEIDPPPVLSVLAGPTVLIFFFDVGDSIPLPTMTVNDLLDWSGWQLSTAVTASAGYLVDYFGADVGYETPYAPTFNVSYIEAPYGLYISPTSYDTIALPTASGFSTNFVTRAEPLVSPAGVVDITMTELQVAPLEAGGTPVITSPQVCAIWARDLDGSFDVTPESGIWYGNIVEIT